VTLRRLRRPPRCQDPGFVSEKIAATRCPLCQPLAAVRSTWLRPQLPGRGPGPKTPESNCLENERAHLSPVKSTVNPTDAYVHLVSQVCMLESVLVATAVQLRDLDDELYGGLVRRAPRSRVSVPEVVIRG
jgi:hypothetical protein